ncbi:hypothetical protein PGB90_007241 [Kerria lacca]
MMDMSSKLKPPEKSIKTRKWQPQSRIADYIKGKVKLEDIISKDKIVRPQDRHNKQAFLPPLNNKEIILRTVRKKRPVRKCSPPQLNRVCTKINSSITLTEPSLTNESLVTSRTDRFQSTSTKTFNTAETTEPRCQQTNVEQLARTLVEKNQEIAKLKEKIENFRDFVHLDMASHGDEVNEDVLSIVGRLFDRLVNISTNLQYTDTKDEEVLAFLANIERERRRWYSFSTNIMEDIQTLKLKNQSLCVSNAEKDCRLNETTAMNTKLKFKLTALEKEFQMEQATKNQLEITSKTITEKIKIAREQNNKLRNNLCHYEQKFSSAVDELSKLGKLGDRVRNEFEIKKLAFEELNAKQHARVHQLEKTITDLEKACCTLQLNSDEKNQKQIAELEERYRLDIETIKDANEKYIKQIQKEKTSLENDVCQLKEKEQSLLHDNENMQMKLRELINTNQLLNVELNEAKREKQILEEAWNEWRRKSQNENLDEANENLMTEMLVAEEHNLKRLMQDLDDTMRCTGLINEEDVK